MAAWLKLSKMAKASRHCASIQAAACLVLTCPDGMGRERVRSTAPSKSRSVISFQVQPAPRISQAPKPQAMKIHRSPQRGCPSAKMARAKPHQQGNSNNHVPMGRSARDRRR